MFDSTILFLRFLMRLCEKMKIGWLFSLPRRCGQTEMGMNDSQAVHQELFLMPASPNEDGFRHRVAPGFTYIPEK